MSPSEIQPTSRGGDSGPSAVRRAGEGSSAADSAAPGEGQVVTIREFRLEDERSVVALWQECDLIRSWNDPGKDIARKGRVRPDLFLVGVLDGAIVATVMAGYDGHRGRINYLAVTPTMRRQGHGRALMQDAERRLRDTGCPKINLQIRSANAAVVAFYRALGYAEDAVVSMGKRLEPD